MKRLFFPRLYYDFENPHLFILKNHPMMARISDNRIIRGQLRRAILPQESLKN